MKISIFISIFMNLKNKISIKNKNILEYMILLEIINHNMNNFINTLIHFIQKIIKVIYQIEKKPNN
jgi:hypothetical protein